MSNNYNKWIVVLVLLGSLSLLFACSGGGGGGGETVVINKSVTLSINFPGLVIDSKGGKVLPTYISHIISSATYPLANISIKNTGSPLSAQVTIDLPSYGEPTTQTVTLGTGETKAVSISPTINFPQLFLNTTNLPANIVVTVISGNETLFNQSYPIQITGRNTVFWSSNGNDMSGYIAAMVTPQDKSGSIQALLRDAANRFTGGTIMPGYQLASWPTQSFSVTPGLSNDKYESFYSLSGESISVSIDSVVSVGTGTAFLVAIMDSTNYAKWSMGQTATACAHNDAATANTVLQCITPNAGMYYIVYHNPSSNVYDRIVTRHRPMTKWETTYYQAKAIFEELRAKGLVYVNLTGTGFFSSSQNVLYPSESISNQSANCLDGAILFASALEALNMKPLLTLNFTAGHAIVSVAAWSDSTTIMSIETTMVGSYSATFNDAVSSGHNTYNSWQAAGQLKLIDVKEKRTVGITPAPM